MNLDTASICCVYIPKETQSIGVLKGNAKNEILIICIFV